MIRYTRHQVLLLALALGVAALGLAVREWRALHPALAERLEQFDREPPRPPAPPPSERVPLRDRAERALDLNHATLEDLSRLPGVGPVLASRILEARVGTGRFASVDDLRRVRGLGIARLERLRPLVTVVAP